MHLVRTSFIFEEYTCAYHLNNVFKMTEDNELNKRKLESTDENDQKKQKLTDTDAKPKSPASEESSKTHEQETSDEKESKDPEHSKEETEGTKTPEDEIREQNKPIFGAASKFGNAFEKLSKQPSIFDKTPSTEPETKQKPAAFGSGSFGTFGSNSKFGNAFQKALEKPSFLDDPEKSSTPEAKEENKPKSSQQYKQVDLEAKEVKTGEEDEESVFTATCKIFELDLANIKLGWKERGLGPLHLNQSKLDPKKVRIVMRSQGLLRVVLNYKITPETELIKGLEASMSPGKFLRVNVAQEGKVAQYLIKFANEEVRNELTDRVDELKKEIAK